MKKKFNITGLCIKNKHYMVDTTDKINRIINMIESGDYFVINRPRQYGKTTTLNILKGELMTHGYLVIKISFEGVGENFFSSESTFCRNVLCLFAASIEVADSKTADFILKYSEKVSALHELSGAITRIVKESRRQIVLLVDEVDKNSNNKIFLQFLGLLRNKYLAACSGEDITFQSVILAGVRDIRTLKLAMRNENEAGFNSPWNISAKFDIDMSFSAKEIESMLLEYQSGNDISFGVTSIAERIHQFTNGYPYLVSDICKIIDETLNAVWTEDNVYTAVKIMLTEKNTLFEDVIKNIENNKDIKIVVEEMLIYGRRFEYHPMVHDEGIMYGIFRRENNRLAIHNRTFETYIYTYLVGRQELKRWSLELSISDEKELAADADLHMEKILLKFKDFMFEEFRRQDERFYESQARLIFLAYLKPILNGKGFYFVEPQTRENKRLDVVVIYGTRKYVIELKIWNGEKYHEKGREQLAEYLDIQNLKEGYLLVFNFNQNKENFSKWVQVGDKKLFEVVL